LSGGTLPSALSRRTLPLRLARFWARSAFWASPVLAYSLPSGPKRSRPPSWYLLRRIPLISTCREPVSRAFPTSFIRMIRLSVGEVCMMYSHRSVANAGEIARPSRPPSPSVLCTPGTVPTDVRTPVAGSRRVMSWASRRV
jgi:hypothetical protein